MGRHGRQRNVRLGRRRSRPGAGRDAYSCGVAAVPASAPNSTDWITAVVACVTVGIYVVVVWFAKRQVDAARETREQAARDAEKARQAQLVISRAEARPYVYLRLDASEPPMLYLRLENVGKTAAAKMRVTVTPPLASTLDRPGAGASRGLR